MTSEDFSQPEIEKSIYLYWRLSGYMPNFSLNFFQVPDRLLCQRSQGLSPSSGEREFVFMVFFISIINNYHVPVLLPATCQWFEVVSNGTERKDGCMSQLPLAS